MGGRLPGVSNADRSSDRCFLKIDGGSLNPIAAVRHFRDLSVGERVYTIGNPSGLSKTPGEGLISGLREHNDIRYVQTTAPISAGSSGGALVDSKGALVGITLTLRLQPRIIGIESQFCLASTGERRLRLELTECRYTSCGAHLLGLFWPLPSPPAMRPSLQVK
jgi:hypothetical protein